MIFDKERLLMPDTYHASIHPTDWSRELADKVAEEEKKRLAEEAKAKAAAAKAGCSGGRRSRQACRASPEA